MGLQECDHKEKVDCDCRLCIEKQILWTHPLAQVTVEQNSVLTAAGEA